MERSIDRTSYRRSARKNYHVEQKVEEIEESKSRKKFKLTNMVLNQMIVSLLIMILILTAQYFEVNDIIEWIKENMSYGYHMSEIIAKINRHFPTEDTNLYSMINSGEAFSGEQSGERIISGEKISGDTVNEESYISAVEGINQMADDASKIQEKYSLQIPIHGVISSKFGSRNSDSSIVSSYHAGLDIAANTGTEICAAHDGKVIMAQIYSSYGNCVMIENENLITVYAHCSALLVSEGQNVHKGDAIAKVGMTGNATGPHLHFEIRYEGRLIDPQKVLEF